MIPLIGTMFQRRTTEMSPNTDNGLLVHQCMAVAHILAMQGAPFTMEITTGKNFSFKIQSDRNKLGREEIRRFHCEHCSISFRTLAGLTYHVDLNH